MATLLRDGLGLRRRRCGRRVQRGIIPATFDADVGVALLFPAVTTPLLAAVFFLPVAVGPMPAAMLPFPITSDPDPATALTELLVARWWWCFAWPDVDNEISFDLRIDSRSPTVVADVRISGGR